MKKFTAFTIDGLHHGNSQEEIIKSKMNHHDFNEITFICWWDAEGYPHPTDWDCIPE